MLIISLWMQFVISDREASTSRIYAPSLRLIPLSPASTLPTPPSRSSVLHHFDVVRGLDVHDRDGYAVREERCRRAQCVVAFRPARRRISHCTFGPAPWGLRRSVDHVLWSASFPRLSPQQFRTESLLRLSVCTIICVFAPRLFR